MSDYEKNQIKDRNNYLNCTKNHRMTVLNDDGLYRNIRVENPDSFSYHYTITTVPGYLMVTGDMGSYTFSRLRDMFEFHSIKWDREVPTIDYNYWAEKCQAVAKHRDIYVYKQEELEKYAKETLKEMLDDYNFSDKYKEEIMTDFQEEVLEWLNGDEYSDMQLVMEFSFLDETYRIRPFEDIFTDGNFKEICVSFKWVCWAIAHTVRDYYRGYDKIGGQEREDNLILKGKI